MVHRICKLLMQNFSFWRRILTTPTICFSNFRQLFCCAIGTADIAAEYADVRPLDDAYKRTLSVNGVHLLDLIDASDDFITALASCTVGCITCRQRDHLLSIEPRHRNNKLMELLTRRSVASFKQFTRVLSKYQAHLVPLMVTEGGEIFLVHGQVTIIFVVSVCLSVCLFVQSFSQPSSIRFRSN